MARQRARHAGCSLRLRGAQVTRPDVQTIAQVRHHGDTVTAWVNPLCSTMAAPGPPSGEPKITTGPTELIVGLYLAGGPHRWVSVPNCRTIAGTPSAGTITVRNGSGPVVATAAVAPGHLATIPLTPGTYTVSGTFSDATVNGKLAETLPASVTVAAGHTVRSALVLPIK